MLLLDAERLGRRRRTRETATSAAARSVLDHREAPLAALDLTLYEVANVVGVALGQPGAGARAVPHDRCPLRRTGIVAVDVRTDRRERCELAAEHGLTAYDAAYVAAARRHGWTLVSTDVRDLVSKGLAVTPDAADYP